MAEALSVVLIEDNDDDAVILEREIRRGGYDVKCTRVETEDDFLHALRVSCDIIITDYYLPQFTGMRVLDILQEKHCDIPCIMVSGKYGEETAVEAMRAGASDFLVKGNLSRLVPAIRRELKEYRMRKSKEQLEARLIEREEIFRRLIEQSVEGVILTDDEGVILEWNNAMMQITEIASVSVVGEPVWQVFADLRVTIFNETMDVGVLKKEWNKRREHSASLWQHGMSEVKIHTLHGQTRIIESDIFTVSTTTLASLHCILCRDISDRVLTAQKIIDSENRYKTLLSSVTDYIFTVKTVQGRVVSTTHSEGCRAITGYSPEEFAHNTLLWHAMIHPDDQTLVAGFLSDVLHGVVIPSFEHRIFKKDGTLRWVRNTIVIHTDHDGRVEGYDGLISDVTERKIAEDALIKREKMLEAIDFASEMFLKNVDWRGVIPTIIERIGTAAGVSRVYVFQNGFDGKDITMTQIVEWTSDGVTPQISNPDLHAISYKKAGAARWLTLGDDTVISGYVKDFPLSERKVLLPQGIQSILVVPIFVKKEWWGFIGFDECRYLREWISSELELLKLLANNIGIAIEHYLADKVQAEYIAMLSELSETAGNFNESESIDSIFEIVGAMIERILPDAFAILSYHNEALQAVQVRRCIGSENMIPLVSRAIGKSLQDITISFHDMTDEEKRLYTNNCLEKIPGGLYDISARTIPKKMSIMIERMLNVHSVYAMGFSIHGQLLGGVTLLLPTDNCQDYQKQTIETVIQQASIAINRIRTTEALRMSEEKYRQLVELAQEGILSIVPDGTVGYANARMATILGYATVDQLIGKNMNEILTAEMGDVFVQLSKNEYSSQTRQYEFEFITQDGNKVYTILSSAVVVNEMNEYTGTVALVTDITALKIAQEEEKIRQQQLIQADKMVSLGMLVSGVAHEVNNPNNFILLNIPLIRQFIENSLPILDAYVEENGDFTIGKRLGYQAVRESFASMLNGIEEGALRIKNIVEELKDFARQDTMDIMEKININDALDGAVHLISPFVRKMTKHFHIKKGDELPYIRANYQRLEQVIINLLQNACQALTDIQQAVTVSTYYDVTTTSVVLEITDEGCGICKDDLKRITEPFFTTKSEKKGTGLGLSVSLKIIQEHSGKMEFFSEPGCGTRVKVTLPKYSGG